jgi:hypothetical protein
MIVARVYNVGEGLDFIGKFTTRNFTIDGVRLHAAGNRISRQCGAGLHPRRDHRIRRARR